MFAYQNMQRAVRNERWKLIRYPLVNRTQLFDLAADPHETTNLADSAGCARRIADLSRLLARDQKAFGDTSPLKIPNPKPGEWSPQ